MKKIKTMSSISGGAAPDEEIRNFIYHNTQDEQGYQGIISMEQGNSLTLTGTNAIAMKADVYDDLEISLASIDFSNLKINMVCSVDPVNCIRVSNSTVSMI